MSSFKKSFFTGIVWKFFFYVSAFLLNAFIAHTFGAADSGQFYYLLNNLSFAVLVLSLGFDAAVNYYNGTKQISRNQLFTLSVLFCITVSILFAAGYWLLSYFSIIPNHTFNTYIVWYVTGTLAFNVFTSFYYSEHRHNIPNGVSTLLNIALLLLLPGVVFKTVISTNLFIRIYLSMNVLAAVWIILLLLLQGARYNSLNSFKLSGSGFIKYALQSFILSLLFTLLLRCDYWIVGHYCSSIEIGNYLQTSKCVQLVMLLPSLASFTLFPLIVQSITTETGIELKLLRLMNIYIYISLFICIAIVLTGHFLFPLIYGNTFGEMYKIFLFLIPGLIALVATYPLTPYFSAKKIMPKNITAMLLSIIVLFVADILLIPIYNVYGAAIGCSLGYCTYLFFLLYYFKKQVDYKLVDLINFTTFFSELKLVLKKISPQNED